MKTSILKPKRTYITIQTLKSMNACAPEIRYVKYAFGITRDTQRIYITVENLQKAFTTHMNLTWLMRRALSVADMNEYSAEYRKLIKRYYSTGMKWETLALRTSELAFKYLTERWK